MLVIAAAVYARNLRGSGAKLPWMRLMQSFAGRSSHAEQQEAAVRPAPGTADGRSWGGSSRYGYPSNSPPTQRCRSGIPRVQTPARRTCRAPPRSPFSTDHRHDNTASGLNRTLPACVICMPTRPVTRPLFRTHRPIHVFVRWLQRRRQGELWFLVATREAPEHGGLRSGKGVYLIQHKARMPPSTRLPAVLPSNSFGTQTTTVCVAVRRIVGSWQVKATGGPQLPSYWWMSLTEQYLSH